MFAELSTNKIYQYEKSIYNIRNNSNDKHCSLNNSSINNIILINMKTFDKYESFILLIFGLLCIVLAYYKIFGL